MATQRKVKRKAIVQRQSDDDQRALQVVMRAFEDCKGYHDNFVREVDRRYEAYRGYLRLRSDAAQWRSKLAPPHVFQTIQTIIGSLIDEVPRTKIRPRPKMVYGAHEIQAAVDAAHAAEISLRYVHDRDQLDRKQWAWAQQASVCGLTVAKDTWAFEKKARSRWEPRLVPVYDEDGNVIHELPQMQEARREYVCRDEPTFEVWNVRDFFWPEGALSIERAPWVVARSWEYPEELRRLEDLGVYRNVGLVGDTRDMQAEEGEIWRSDLLFEQERTKGKIELLEYWEDDRVVTVANRAVVLRDEINPFWHGRKPFVASSTMPEMFQLVGVSDVELVQDLQEALWMTMNQRLDNLALINNAIVMVNADIEDLDAFEFAPGEFWPAKPGDVTPWTPNTMPAEISISAERMFKGDLQDITGGMPFMAGVDSGVANDTATGTAIFTTLAQKRLAAKKRNLGYALREKAEMDLEMLAQFWTRPMAISVIGKDGVEAWETVSPDQLGQDFVLEIDNSNESMMRQERRAEATNLLSASAQASQPLALAGTPLNMKAVYQEFLRAHGIEDTERFFASQPPMQPGALPDGMGGGEPFENPDEPPTGITGNGSIDAAVSPSNQTSLAPTLMLQRALAAGDSR